MGAEQEQEAGGCIRRRPWEECECLAGGWVDWGRVACRHCDEGERAQERLDQHRIEAAEARREERGR